MRKDIDLGELLAAPQEMCPAVYQYYKGLENRRIILNDQFDSNIVETVALPLIDMDNDGTGKPIEIILSSPGGSVFDALFLANIIDGVKTPVTIRVMGYAYSMGSLILMAGYSNTNVRKVCYGFSTGLIHGGSTYLEGTASAVKDTFKFHENMEEKIKQYVLTHSLLTEEDYQKSERYELYLTAEDMLRLKIVDEIL